VLGTNHRDETPAGVGQLQVWLEDIEDLLFATSVWVAPSNNKLTRYGMPAF